MSEREIKTKSLVSKSIAKEFESMPYGLLASMFVTATSPLLSGATSEEGMLGNRGLLQCIVILMLMYTDACSVYLHTFWKYAKASSSYAGLLRLHADGKLGVACRLLLALCNSTASFEVLTHTATVMMLISCTTKLNEMSLPWQALNSLNSMEIANGANAEDVVMASPEGEGVTVTQACTRIVSMLRKGTEKVMVSEAHPKTH